MRCTILTYEFIRSFMFAIQKIEFHACTCAVNQKKKNETNSPRNRHKINANLFDRNEQMK